MTRCALCRAVLVEEYSWWVDFAIGSAVIGGPRTCERCGLWLMCEASPLQAWMVKGGTGEPVLPDFLA